ncbi:MAG: hypothetical protein MUO57_01195 [Anaerolineales bacterium]|nr:hypothetical protein [Anaerolineales bacterium]
MLIIVKRVAFDYYFFYLSALQHPFQVWGKIFDFREYRVYTLGKIKDQCHAYIPVK